MYKEASDNRLKHLLANHLTNDAINPEHAKILKSQRLCGSQVMKSPGWQPAVYVMTNDEDSKLFGVTHCNSSWACPHCTPIVMARYGERIACAIDALSKWDNQLATMFTFTIPHTSGMSAEDVLQILMQTWRMFTRDGNRKYRRDYYTKKDGTTSTYDKAGSAYGRMRNELQSTHNVRVYEATWGENSWHFHVHMLIWFPKQTFYQCIKYEEDLLDRWWHCAEYQCLKYYNKKYPNKSAENLKMVKELYADWRKYPKTGHRSFWISKDATGMPAVMKSSYYISGWSGDFEMTHEHTKDARFKGHYSPHQLLIEADKAKQAGNKERYKQFMNLYVEYAVATKGKIRCQFSQSGINAIVLKWKQTNTYFETVKKKFTELAQGRKPYKIAVWFTEQQWSELSYLDKHSNTAIIANILEIATLKKSLEKRRQLLIEYVKLFDIDISNNLINKQARFVESKIFENRFVS